LAGERERDRPGPGADVEDRQLAGAALELAQDELDERLGVAPGDEDAPVDGEGQRPELLLADEVGDRLAGEAAADELPRPRELGRGERLLEVGVELDAAQAEGVADEDLRLEPRRLEPGRREARGRPL